jgi:hypothetical protein
MVNFWKIWMLTSADLDEIFRVYVFWWFKTNPHAVRFYLPHMEYEGSRYWFSVEKNEKKNSLIFTFWNFLWINNMIWAIKNFPSITRRCRRRRRRRSHKFVSHLQLPPYELESWNSGSRSHLGQLDVPYTQNLEIHVPKGSHLREVFEVLLFKP